MKYLIVIAILFILLGVTSCREICGYLKHKDSETIEDASLTTKKKDRW